MAILRGKVTVGAGAAAPFTITVAQGDIDKAFSASEQFTPEALEVQTPGDFLFEQLTLKNAKNSEGQLDLVADGDPLKADVVNNMLGAISGGFVAVPMSAANGLVITGVVASAGGADLEIAILAF